MLLRNFPESSVRLGKFLDYVFDYAPCSTSSNRRCPWLEATKREKEWGRQVHRDNESLIIIGAHCPLPTHSSRPRIREWMPYRLIRLVCCPNRRVWRKAGNRVRLCPCTRGIRRHDSQRYKGAQRQRWRQKEKKRGEKGSEQICRSEWIRGYGSSNKVIFHSQTAGTMVSRGERSSTSRNTLARKRKENSIW